MKSHFDLAGKPLFVMFFWMFHHPWNLITPSKAVLVIKKDVSFIPGSGRFPGGGNGNPPQYSCLENPMDRGAWRATVHGLYRVRHNWSGLAHAHHPTGHVGPYSHTCDTRLGFQTSSKESSQNMVTFLPNILNLFIADMKFFMYSGSESLVKYSIQIFISFVGKLIHLPRWHQ